MANDKLLRSNVTLLLAYPEAFANPLAPTSAELNAQFAWSPTPSQGNMVFNVSCATLDDYSMNQTDSDTDDTRTVCDANQVTNPTFKNYEVDLTFLRDSDIDGQGIYNMSTELVSGVDQKLFAYKRIGKLNTETFATNDEVSIFGVTEDYSPDNVDSGELVSYGAKFKPTGELLINYKLAA